MLDTFELAALKGELTSIHRIADMGLAALAHAEGLQDRLDETVADASLQAHAAEQFVEVEVEAAESHNAEREAKIVELEKRIAEHVCAGPTATNLVQPQAQAEFEAELRRELQVARQMLQGHQTTINRQAETNAKLKTEAERDRRELRDALDGRQAAIERLDAARKALKDVDDATDSDVITEFGHLGVISRVEGIAAQGLADSQPQKTEAGESLLIVLGRVRGDCERAQAESARLQAEVNGLREQIRQAQQDAGKDLAPWSKEQWQAVRYAVQDVRNALNAWLGLANESATQSVEISAGRINDAIQTLTLRPLTDDGLDLLATLAELRHENEQLRAAAAHRDEEASPAADMARLQQDLTESEAAREVAENRAAALQQFIDKPLTERFEKTLNRIADMATEGCSVWMIRGAAQAALKELEAIPL